MTTHRISKNHSLKDLYVLGQGSGHEEGLVDFRHVPSGEDLFDVVRVTVGKDEIGFVDGEGFEGSEGEGLAEIAKRI